MTEGVREKQSGFHNMEIIPRGGERTLDLSPARVLEIGLGKRDNEAYMVKVWREGDKVSVEIPSTGEHREVRHFPEVDPSTGKRLVLEFGRSRDAVQPQHVRVCLDDPTDIVSNHHALLIFGSDQKQVVLSDRIEGKRPSTNGTFWRLVSREEALRQVVAPRATEVVQRGGVLEMRVGTMTVRWTPNRDPEGRNLLVDREGRRNPKGEIKQTAVFTSSLGTTFLVLGENQELEKPKPGVLQTNVLPEVFQALQEETENISPGLSIEAELQQIIKGGNSRFTSQRDQKGEPPRRAALAIMAIRGEEIRGMFLGVGSFEIYTLSSSGAVAYPVWANSTNMRYAFGDQEVSDPKQVFNQFPINKAQLSPRGAIFLSDTETRPFQPSRHLNIPQVETTYDGRVIEITVGQTA